MPWTTPGTATAGSVLTASFLNTNVRDNTNMLYSSIQRLAYQTRATNLTVDQTAVASAAEVFASDLSFTADGTSAYLVEAYFPAGYSGTTNYNVTGYLCKGDGTIIVAMIDFSNFGRNPIGVNRYYYTPSAGAQTVNFRFIKETGAANGTIECGAAPIGGGNYAPGYLAVFGPPML